MSEGEVRLKKKWWKEVKFVEERERLMMYLPRVQANTQIKSEAYKPKVDTIKGKPRESGT